MATMLARTMIRTPKITMRFGGMSPAVVNIAWAPYQVTSAPATWSRTASVKVRSLTARRPNRMP